ncbi:TerD family protein [Chryseobacterium sp. MEBOG06]|uniref:TerD family protein n=1 Tax=unclassified Chryseobacterium TaxID=2593645 RepID=UPI001F24084E|nr:MULTISPECIES: TerD family protein [unclassified Chryseobacterium]UKB82634.1 TerD family protein [Chryseobacterium sp. MEBOG06]
MSINLQKITLEKKGDTHSIDLTKTGISQKEIVINLNWSQPQQKKGFFSSLLGGNNSIDLDLGCFYELQNGKKDCIDGLQFANGNGGSREKLTRQGRYNDTPFIWHTGDDRGSNAGSGENILVNPNGINSLKRIVIYCFIYDGVARWNETNGIINIKASGNPDIEVEMGKQNDSRKFCAIAEILFFPNSMQVKKLVTFHNSHADCDKMYHWGMKWAPGSK